MIKKVDLVLDDIDRHGAGCGCGLCNSNGKSYGVAVIMTGTDEAIERIYAPSEEAAFYNARLFVKAAGFVEEVYL